MWIQTKLFLLVSLKQQLRKDLVIIYFVIGDMINKINVIGRTRNREK